MKKRLILCLFAVLSSCISSAAQQAQPQMQPLTFWYEYTVNPGKEDEFMELVKTVGQPVRDKLMADGIVMALRFRQWPDAAMKHFADAVSRGSKPITPRSRRPR